MERLKKIVCALGVFALVAFLFGAPAAKADDPKPKVKKPDEPKPTPTEGPKVIVIQLDASKLPPDVLKKLLELGGPAAGTKPETKPEPEKPAQATKPSPEKKPAPTASGKVISLADAIAIAEKTAKGTATKAAREVGKDGTVAFEVEVTDPKGNKSKVVIDAAGQVVGSKQEGGEGDKNAKTKKKGDDEDKDEQKGNKGDGDMKPAAKKKGNTRGEKDDDK